MRRNRQNVRKKIQDSTEYYKHADAKPGSIAAKARMVQQFDEKNPKGKKKRIQSNKVIKRSNMGRRMGGIKMEEYIEVSAKTKRRSDHECSNSAWNKQR